jgi:hypothetical protein
MRWNSGDPQSLNPLKYTPVNCALLERTNWNPGSGETGGANEDGRCRAGGRVRFGRGRPAARGLVDTGAIAIELPIRRHARIDSHDPVVGTSQALWPGVELEHGGRSVTRPSSNPWINTNSGFLRFVRASTNAAIWVDVRPPPKLAVTVDQYGVAITDSAMTGAHWIVSLDDDLDRRLLAGDAQAAGSWKRIAAYLRYFETYTTAHSAKWRL